MGERVWRERKGSRGSKRVKEDQRGSNEVSHMYDTFGLSTLVWFLVGMWTGSALCVTGCFVSRLAACVSLRRKQKVSEPVFIFTNI